MTTLVCGDCQHENEPERIYCHNCGARLNRSVLEKEKAEAKKKEEAPAETQKRLRKIMNPRGAKIRHQIMQVTKLLGAALIAAALVLMASPPDLPPQQSTNELGPQIGLDLEMAVTDHRGATLSYTEDQITAYLANTLKRKKKDLDQPMLPFEKAFVRFDEGVFGLTESRSFFGLPIYGGVLYNVAIQDGQLKIQNCGGAIGRMPIHPKLMQYGDVIFADLWKALEQDRKKVAKLQAIEFHPKTVSLTAPLQ